MNIINERLKISLQALFSKSFDSISSDDLAELKSVAIDSVGLSKEDAENDIKEVLSSCINLEAISMKNTFITSKIMEAINNTNISRIYLDKCAFEDEKNISLPSALKEFEMRRCFLDDYTDILNNLPKGLEILNISYPADESSIDLSLLNNIESLQVLVLDGCIINWNNCQLNDCRYLSLLGTEVTEEMANNISKLPQLKELFISERFNILDGIQPLFDTIKIRNDLSEYVFEEETINKNL